MLEPHAPEIRRELNAVRVAALRRAAGPSTPGPLRRAVGNAFVRLGLLLLADQSAPTIDSIVEQLRRLRPGRVPRGKADRR